MKIFSLIITFIIYNCLFSQNVENRYDSVSNKLVESTYYKKELIEYKVFYNKNGNISEKIWYDENGKLELKIVYTYSEGVLVKRTWYNKSGDLINTVLD